MTCQVLDCEEPGEQLQVCIGVVAEEDPPTLAAVLQDTGAFQLCDQHRHELQDGVTLLLVQP